MKKLLLAILMLGAVSAVRADDIADAKKAFDSFIEYQKTDDDRTLSLFTDDIEVTVTLTDGTKTKDITLPPEVFRDSVTKSLAKKEGSKDVYEDVKFTQDGSTVKVTATLTDGKTGKKGPFMAVYVRDASGQLKVKALKATITVDHVPDGA